MTDDIIRDLRKIQRYAAGLQRLITDAQDKAPRSATGSDSSGAVTVTLGPDGLPNSFRVQPDWNRRVQPEAFGSAVMEAFQAAMGNRLNEWTSTLRKDDWQDRVDRLESEVERTPPAAGAVPPAFRPPAKETRPRSLGDMTEDMIKAFDNLDKIPSQPQRPTGTGSSAGGKLQLTVSTEALVSCVAEPRWVADQTAARLMNALGECLSQARTQLATLSPTAEPGRPLDRLFGEVMGLLNDPRRLAES